jgi:hypothetical protein
MFSNFPDFLVQPIKNTGPVQIKENDLFKQIYFEGKIIQHGAEFRLIYGSVNAEILATTALRIISHFRLMATLSPVMKRQVIWIKNE